MSRETIPIEISKRKARQQRVHQFEALAAFANMGDTPEDWQRFRLCWPELFPVTESEYSQPGFRSVTEWLYTFANEWAKEFGSVKAITQPPLLWYRDLLRTIWTRNDPAGINLSLLLGFVSEREAQRRACGPAGPYAGWGTPRVAPMAVPGQPANSKQQDTFGGLPQGRVNVDGVLGEIKWEFSCQLQRALYDLMQERWRAMVCPQCGKYFIADKTAQKFCSTRCYGEKKQVQALDYYYRKGRNVRQKEKLTQANSIRRKQR